MKTSVNALHHLNNDWQKELTFYKDELKVLQNRLGEVATKNTSQEVLAQVEHFQNKFIILNQQADNLKHDANKLNDQLNALASDKPEHTHQKSLPEAEGLQARVAGYAKEFSEIRFELNMFLSKVM
jgi:predicted  nucleic acid-binding Zn-ribbon protein